MQTEGIFAMLKLPEFKILRLIFIILETNLFTIKMQLPAGDIAPW